MRCGIRGEGWRDSMYRMIRTAQAFVRQGCWLEGDVWQMTRRGTRYNLGRGLELILLDSLSTPLFTPVRLSSSHYLRMPFPIGNGSLDLYRWLAPMTPMRFPQQET